MANEVAKYAYAFKKGTVSSSALVLTSVGIAFSAAEVAAADEALITVETNPLRYTIDGTAPTSTDGHPVAAAASFVVSGRRDIGNLKLIRSGASDATVHITLRKWS